MTATAGVVSAGRAVLGIELGSTRIKAVLTDPSGQRLASGVHSWESRLEDGHWTYSQEHIEGGSLRVWPICGATSTRCMASR